MYSTHPVHPVARLGLFSAATQGLFARENALGAGLNRWLGFARPPEAVYHGEGSKFSLLRPFPGALFSEHLPLRRCRGLPGSPVGVWVMRTALFRAPHQ